MFRFYLVLFFLFFSSASFASEIENQLKSFLESRVVVGQVFFAASSSKLSQASRNDVDRLVPKLREITDSNVLIRVEGFASPEGELPDNVNLSMYRALAVRTYLIETHGLDLDVFLTGFGPVKPSRDKERARRVDIAMYRQSEAVSSLFDDQGLVEKFIIR